MRQTVAHHVVWGEAYRRLAERAGWRAAFLDPNALATLDAMYRTPILSGYRITTKSESTYHEGQSQPQALRTAK